MYDFLTTSPWPDYELIDSGNFQKLERFGKYLLARPEPQAIWDPHLPLKEWERADAAFARAPGSTEKGQWRLKPDMPEQWLIDYQRPDGLKLKFRLGLSSFKHVGLFPEQDPNWQFIYNQTRRRRAQLPRVLNLFAYTGAATLAARAAGAGQRAFFLPYYARTASPLPLRPAYVRLPHHLPLARLRAD